MCDNCVHKAVCSIYRATGGVKSCEHHKEERRGRWVAIDDDYEALEDQEEAMRWGCTTCHEVVEYDDWTHRNRLTKFCPNCGADMQGMPSSAPTGKGR